MHNKHANDDSMGAQLTEPSADEAELSELKKKYSSQWAMLKELYPDWSDMDLLVALEENEGDLQTTVEKISEGTSSSIGGSGAVEQKCQ